MQPPVKSSAWLDSAWAARCPCTRQRRIRHIGACVVFYGGHPNVKPDLPNLHAPVLGLYAERDGFVTPALVRELESKLKELGKPI